MIDLLLGVMAGCSFATSIASVVLAYRCNEILRAADAVTDLIQEQTRIMRQTALRSRQGYSEPPTRRSMTVR